MAHGLQLALQLANCSCTFVAKHGQAIIVLVARVVVLLAAVGQTLEGIGGLLLGQRVHNSLYVWRSHARD